VPPASAPERTASTRVSVCSCVGGSRNASMRPSLSIRRSGLSPSTRTVGCWMFRCEPERGLILVSGGHKCHHRDGGKGKRPPAPGRSRGAIWRSSSSQGVLALAALTLLTLRVRASRGGRAQARSSAPVERQRRLPARPRVADGRDARGRRRAARVAYASMSGGGVGGAGSAPHGRVRPGRLGRRPRLVRRPGRERGAPPRPPSRSAPRRPRPRSSRPPTTSPPVRSPRTTRRPGGRARSRGRGPGRGAPRPRRTRSAPRSPPTSPRGTTTSTSSPLTRRSPTGPVTRPPPPRGAAAFGASQATARRRRSPKRGAAACARRS
jgi:hypothetical protein